MDFGHTILENSKCIAELVRKKEKSLGARNEERIQKVLSMK